MSHTLVLAKGIHEASRRITTPGHGPFTGRCHLYFVHPILNTRSRALTSNDTSLPSYAGGERYVFNVAVDDFELFILFHIPLSEAHYDQIVPWFPRPSIEHPDACQFTALTRGSQSVVDQHTFLVTGY